MEKSDENKALVVLYKQLNAKINAAEDVIQHLNDYFIYQDLLLKSGKEIRLKRLANRDLVVSVYDIKENKLEFTLAKSAKGREPVRFNVVDVLREIVLTEMNDETALIDYLDFGEEEKKGLFELKISDLSDYFLE